MPKETASAGRVAVALTDRFARGDAAAGEHAPADYLILDLSSGRYFGIGEVGGFVWEQLDGERDLQEIARAVSGEFDVEPERAAADLVELVGWLQETGLAARVP